MRKFNKNSVSGKKVTNQKPVYETTFLTSSTVKAKDGKTVYVRHEHHARMTRIINTIGRNSLSITDYLDNVL